MFQSDREPSALLMGIKAMLINFVMRFMWVIGFVILLTVCIWLWKHENLSSKIGVEVHKFLIEIRK